MPPGTAFTIAVTPKIPPRLARLEELANDLWYSWDRSTRSLFSSLDHALWGAVGHNPKAFLKRVDESKLLRAAEDRVFLAHYNSVLSAYDFYHSGPPEDCAHTGLSSSDQVAYFCFEFGFHVSFPIYSGGLGILAGDHCKAASDVRLPLVGVGLLYRQGYFSQTIDSEGNQQVIYADSDFEDLPVTPVLHGNGSEVRVEVEMPQRKVVAKIWRAKIGHVTLYLLDTDLPENSQADRDITHQLYGGDRTMRIEQEILLGVGGTRALREMGIRPTVWHINEGHAAFMVLERMRDLVRQGLPFPTALEAVAANTIFTTHTAVPAGHDHFSDDMMTGYFEGFYNDLGISRDDFLALGRAPDSNDFNMTALAIRGSRFQNGVSKIHGNVSARICRHLWPQIEPEENPVAYITNGVHVPTFLAPEWADLFDRYLGHEWRNNICDAKYWSRIEAIPDHLFWSVRQTLKSQMFYGVRARLALQNSRNHGSEAHLDRLLRFTDPVNPNILTIGFARRFATYKRATLLFEDLDWLRRIVLHQERPVMMIFAGKAHPADVPGQDLIRRVSEIARLPEFQGQILLVEDYDLRLARRLVAGVDVWLNSPVYPLEASGTSGMKAAINGGLNLSVLDGWWGEGYNGKNGWAIKRGPENMAPHLRDKEDSTDFYETLQDHVVPLYYNRDKLGYSPEWIKMAKNSMISLLPRFSAGRMVGEYAQNFYVPASRQGSHYATADYSGAQKVADWKAFVRNAWWGVAIRRLDAPANRISFGDTVYFDVAIRLNGLKPEDVIVELLIGPQLPQATISDFKHYKFECTGAEESDEQRFTLNLAVSLCGKLDYRIRVYPYHPLLTHPLEMGMMLWL
ncbi:alpha-glucan family phosphorylase [Nitrosospira briensis]|uniref:alpha-glucan family phosphorylase n=1 Tax=Nitrosospira briensis TaxID=35799 RepID=UPI0008E8022D|nr:alpha-glucan family phosphorylase [Nitrosospira briensis]SFO05625.1 starch phosphorylase [Nitrosospira briensis]